MHKLCKTLCINWQDGSRRYVRVEGAGSKWFPLPSCHTPLSANSLAKWVSNGGFNSNSSINMNDKRKFITMESIWYIFTFFSQFQSPLTVLSSELPKVRHDTNNHTTGGGVFFSSRYAFQHRESEIFANFDQFRLFCCEFIHFSVYFLQAKIVWRCTKIDKYQVRTRSCYFISVPTDHTVVVSVHLRIEVDRAQWARWTQSH